MLPRSETAHPRTLGLDRTTVADLVDLLHSCDAEVFDGLEAAETRRELAALATFLYDARAAGLRRVVLAGAGTSGRLAHLLAARHGRALAEHGIEVVPWIAGGPRALLSAVEGAEDDVVAIREELATQLDAATAFIGISCGLSAPCVAAGIVEAKARGARCAVFGTNDVATARRVPLVGLPGGFFEALALADVVVTPDVGFEPLTGSSRMKGGSATWLCFDAVFVALDEALRSHTASRCAERIAERLDHGRALWKRRFESGRGERIAAIEAMAKALRAGGVVRVVGEGEPGLAAVLDASECQPTFGVDAGRVRAFVAGPQVRVFACPSVDLDAALEDLQRLEARDCLLVIRSEGRPGPLRRAFASAATRVEMVAAELLDAKLTLNAISTGAFVRAGKVYENRMIDVALTTAKLFERAVRIVAAVAGVSEARALRSVVAVLHGGAAPAADLVSWPVHEHLKRARPGIVPRAILHARGSTLAAAEAALARSPIVRDAIAVRSGPDAAAAARDPRDG